MRRLIISLLLAAALLFVCTGADCEECSDALDSCMASCQTPWGEDYVGSVFCETECEVAFNQCLGLW
jgi:hypothetical protein